MRKAPRQQRSRATVDVIVEAAARVLARRGWARFTTNEIAAVAGVSVGSLYQYFPDKLAIAEAIRERHLGEVLLVLSGAHEQDNDAAITLEQRVAQFIDGVIAAHSIDQALHHVLVDEVPLSARSSYGAFEAEYQRRYRALLASSGGSGRDDDGVAARVLSSAVEGVVHSAAGRGDLGLAALRTELVRLILAYLRDRAEG